jgi:tRNA A37 threonylcarbamoyladenosine biosynthesis protein TsaE
VISELQNYHYQGIAEFFGIEDTITSPTFTLMNIYEIKNKNQKSKVLYTLIPTG